MIAPPGRRPHVPRLEQALQSPTAEDVIAMKKHTEEAMTRNLVTISIHESMETAHALMEERDIRHLPVTDEEGYVIGILSERDVRRAMNPARPGFGANLRVADFASWPVMTVDEKTPLAEVALGMIEEKISAFLVTKKSQEVIGIVTSDDLLRVLHQMLKGKEGSFLRTLPYTPVVREVIQELQTLGI